MTIRPAKVIYGWLSGLTVLDTWDYDDGTGDPWVGLPYKYSATVRVTAQPHSSPTDGNAGAGFFYTGLDVAPGDWVFSSGGARIMLITAVTVTDENNITIEMLDDDRVNVANDFTQLGQAGIPGGDCYIFEARGGIPALYPLPPNLPGPIPTQAVAEIISRFSSMRKDRYLDVTQPEYGFPVGQALTLGSDGLYYAYTGDPNHAMCGVLVERVATADGPHKFRYAPVGPVIDLNVAGDLGAIIYIDSSGSYTQEPASDFAQAAFIKLSETQVILLLANLGGEHVLLHASLDNLFIAGRTEIDYDTDGNPLVKRGYRKMGSSLRHMFTTTYVWDVEGTLTRKDIIRIPDGKILRIDYTWTPEGNLPLTERTLL